jgi:hypothetical protein
MDGSFGLPGDSGEEESGRSSRRTALRLLGSGAGVGALLAARPARTGAWLEQSTPPATDPTATATTPAATAESLFFQLGEAPPVEFPSGASVRFARATEFPALSGLSLAVFEVGSDATREMHWHNNAGELGWCLGGAGHMVLVDEDGASISFGLDDCRRPVAYPAWLRPSAASDDRFLADDAPASGGGDRQGGGGGGERRPAVPRGGEAVRGSGSRWHGGPALRYRRPGRGTLHRPHGRPGGSIYHLWRRERRNSREHPGACRHHDDVDDARTRRDQRTALAPGRRLGLLRPLRASRGRHRRAEWSVAVGRVDGRGFGLYAGELAPLHP